jgi:hypothetical protein
VRTCERTWDPRSQCANSNACTPASEYHKRSLALPHRESGTFRVPLQLRLIYVL